MTSRSAKQRKRKQQPRSNPGLITDLRSAFLQAGGHFEGEHAIDQCNDTLLQRVDESAMTADFTIVTVPQSKSAVNRNGTRHRLQQNDDGGGMLLADYARNPVVLWNHGIGQGNDIPIGMSAPADGTPEDLTVQISPRKATARWFANQNLELAQVIFGMVAQGWIRMASIGFRPLKAIRLKQGDRQAEGSAVIDLEAWRRYMEFVETELQEWSVVAIGADRGSFRQAAEKQTACGVSFGLDTAKMLQFYADEPPAWSQGWEPIEGETVFASDETDDLESQSIDDEDDTEPDLGETLQALSETLDTIAESLGAQNALLSSIHAQVCPPPQQSASPVPEAVVTPVETPAPVVQAVSPYDETAVTLLIQQGIASAMAPIQAQFAETQRRFEQAFGSTSQV